MLDLRIGVLDGIAALLAGDDGRRASWRCSTPTRTASTRSCPVPSNIVYLDVEQRRMHDAEAVLDRSLPAIERHADLPGLAARHPRPAAADGGDWARAAADADAVLDAPSAPLARTWPHRALVALRRGDDAGTDLDDAWALAARLGEPIAILPAAAALAERTWLTGEADEQRRRRLGAAARAHRARPRVGAGDLAVWLQALDPSAEVPGGEYSEVHRLQLDGARGGRPPVGEARRAPFEQALALVETGEAESARTGLDLLDRLGADAVAARCARTCASAAWPRSPPAGGRARWATRRA